VFKSPRRPILYGLVILIIVVIPELQFYQNRPEADRSQDYYARDYATNLLESCPPNSIMMVNWDDIFTIWYLQDIENVRKDIIPVLAELPTEPGSNYWGEWYFEELQRKHPEIFEGTGFESTIFLTTEDAVNAFVLANLDHGRDVYFSFYGVSLNFDLFTSFNIHPLGGVYRCSKEQYSITDLIIAQQAWRVTLDNFRNIYNYRDYRIEEEDFIISRISDNLFYTAQLALNLGVRPKAIWFLQQSVKINNLNLNAIVPLAEIYLENGNYPEARDLLLQARDLDPGNPDIHILLARLHLAIGQIELARQSLEIVTSLDPSNPEARTLLERIGTGN
jgi:tetratricopeptide (TPR) repeat protein